MFRLISSLFGCAHRRCTFPITSTASRGCRGANAAAVDVSRNTYVVCLDCGQEFPYDWKHMKQTKQGKIRRTANSVA